MEDRDAQILAECLDELEKGEITLQEFLARYPEQRSELEGLLALAETFQQAPEVKPSLQFRLHSRRSLTNSLSDHNATERFPNIFNRIMKMKDALTQRQGLVLARAAIIGVVLIFTSVVTVQAARQAMPGSPFYGIKIGIETVQLALTGEESDLQLAIQFANERSEEIAWLQAQGRTQDIPEAQAYFDRFIAMAASDLEDDASQAGSETVGELEEDLNDAVRNNISVLEAVLQKVPDQAKPAIEKVLANARNKEAGNPPDDLEVVEGTPVPGAVENPGNEPDVAATKKPEQVKTEKPSVAETKAAEKTAEPEVKPTQKPTKDENPSSSSVIDESGHPNQPQKTKTPPGQDEDNPASNNASNNKDKTKVP